MSRHELGREGAVRIFEYDCHAPQGAKAEQEQFTTFAISVVRSGVFGFRREGRTQHLTRGHLLLSNPGEQYEISHDQGGGDRTLIFRFDEAALEGLVRKRAGGARFTRSVLPPMAKIETLRFQAERAVLAGGEGLEELALLLAARVALALAVAPREKIPIDGRTRARILEQKARLEAHSPAGFRLNELARSAGLSPFHFLRVFKRVVGRTPHQHLIQARLCLAVALLRDSRLPVTDIALEAGFCDLSSFIHTFRREIGCSPSRLRQRT